jgi:c-di-AMP phosphodiesterase-like protein
MLIFISATAAFAFIPTYLKHRNYKIFYLPILSLIILSISTLLIHDFNNKWLETGSSVVGSLILIYAHYKHILKHDHCCNDIHDSCDTSLPDHGHPKKE